MISDNYVNWRFSDVFLNNFEQILHIDSSGNESREFGLNKAVYDIDICFRMWWL